MKSQVLMVKKGRNGKKFWHCNAVGWVPMEVLTVNAQAFREGTEIEVKYILEIKESKDEDRTSEGT